MRIHTFCNLLFIFCFALSSSAQDYHKIVKADSLSQANEFAASIDLINEVLNNNPRNFLKAQAYYQLSYAYLQLFDLDKARDFNQKSLELRDMLHYEFIADNYMRFGTIELLQNKLETALDYFLEAKELPHPDLQFSGILDGYLGATYERLGKTEEALEKYQSSLEILEWDLGENHPDVSVAHYNLGNYYASIERYGEATTHYEKSILIELKKDWGSSKANLRLANAYNGLGLVLFKKNMDVEGAISSFKGAILASKKHRRLTAVSKLNLAETYFVIRDFDLAKKEIDQALSQLYFGEEENLQYSIPMTLDKGLYSRGLQLLTEIYLDEAFPYQNVENLSKAFETSILTIAYFEGNLLDFYTEKNQLQLLLNTRDVFEQTIYIALKLFEITSDTKYQDEAFKYAERGKAIVLKNQMQQFYGMLGADLPENLKKEEQRIRNQLAFFETDLAVKYKADNFRKEVLNLHREYQMLLENIEKSAPQYFDLRYQVPEVSIAAIQEKLSEQEAMLSYYQGNNLYYIFAINKNDVKTYFTAQNAPLETSSKTGLNDLNKKINEKFPKPDKKAKKTDIPKLPSPDVGIYTQYTEDELDLQAGINKGLRSTIKLSKEQFVAANHTLYRRLIEPVKEVIKRKKKLIIVPHNDLHFLTFETLIKTKPKKKVKYNKLKYLLKDYAISYEMSADFMLDKKETSKVILNSISAWAPVFNPSDSLGYVLSTEDLLLDSLSFEGTQMRSLMPDRSTFNMLKYSEDEVVSIINTFAKKNRNGKAFLKADATEVEFKKEALNYNHLHIASHSFVNTTLPKLSGIALAPSGDEDGILFAGEIMNMDFSNTSLVVLSSCESGTGALVRGEGILSLNRAFLFSGVDNTISTRWKISDRASSELMANFYKKVLDGAGYSEALRYAKLKMIKKSKTATPKLWAGFTLTGS